MTEFKSLLKDDIAFFLRQKRAAGYPYEHNEMLLARFDALAKEQFPNEARISREMVEAWLNLLPEEHPNGLLRRVTPIRQLAKFIAGNVVAKVRKKIAIYRSIVVFKRSYRHNLLSGRNKEVVVDVILQINPVGCIKHIVSRDWLVQSLSQMIFQLGIDFAIEY